MTYTVSNPPNSTQLVFLGTSTTGTLSGFPAGYKRYRLFIYAIGNGVSSACAIQFNSDTAANYYTNVLTGVATGTGGVTQTTVTAADTLMRISSNANPTINPVYAVLDIYVDAAFLMLVTGTSVAIISTPGIQNCLISGRYTGAAALTAINICNPTITSSEMVLYGYAS